MVKVSPLKGIWSGVYTSFDEARAAGDKESGHLNPIWIAKSVESLSFKMDSLGPLPTSTLGVVLACTSLPERRILDVGGNLGSHSISLDRQITGDNFDYTVLELADFLDHPEIRRNLLPRVKYARDISELEGMYDVAYFGSVIQYFSKWKEKLREVITAAATPSFLVFDDLMIGPQPSFVSIQKYYDDAMTMWFLNEEEFLIFVQSLGYKLKLKSEFVMSGQNYFPHLSLPVGHRIPFAQTAIFERRSR